MLFSKEKKKISSKSNISNAEKKTTILTNVLKRGTKSQKTSICLGDFYTNDCS